MARIIARLNRGGPALHAILLSEGLARAGVSTLLVTGRVGPDEDGLEALALERGVGLLVIPELGRELRPARDLVAFLRLVRALRRFRPDVVHTHTAKAGTLGRLAALVARVPVRVHTFHGHVLEGYFGPLASRLFAAVERALARVTHRIVVLSEQQRDALARSHRIAPAQKFAIVPLGIELEPFVSAAPADALRRELGLAPDQVLGGFVGRLVPVKDPWLLLAALERLDAPVAVAIAGGGPLASALARELAGRGLGQRARLLGWRREMPALYAELDFVVLTSRNEGTPLALIEGMAAAKPFVATAVGGVPDLAVGPGHEQRDAAGARFVRHANGILVEPGDAAGLAAALSYLARNPEERRAMGKEGRAFALERFGHERLIADVQALYDELREVRRA